LLAILYVSHLERRPSSTVVPISAPPEGVRVNRIRHCFVARVSRCNCRKSVAFLSRCSLCQCWSVPALALPRILFNVVGRSTLGSSVCRTTNSVYTCPPKSNNTSNLAAHFLFESFIFTIIILHILSRSSQSSFSSCDTTNLTDNSLASKPSSPHHPCPLCPTHRADPPRPPLVDLGRHDDIATPPPALDVHLCEPVSMSDIASP
jgi:hypothetical protein